METSTETHPKPSSGDPPAPRQVVMTYLKETHCKLCRFEVERGASIVVVANQGHFTGVLHFRTGLVVLDPVTRFADNLEWGAEALVSNFVPQVECVHAQCLSFAGSSTLNDPRFRNVTKHDFTPSKDLEGERETRIKFLLARRLCEDVLQKYPPEICRMVAGYLVRECAIVSYKELADHRRPEDRVVHTPQGIDASYIRVEGTLYLQSLRQAQAADEEEQAVTFPVEESPAFYMAYDHLGIRDVQVKLPDRDWPHQIREQRGVWWTKVDMKLSRALLHHWTDGLKIRDIAESAEPALERHTQAPRLGWPIPVSNWRLADLDMSQGLLIIPKHHQRMSSFECNRPDTHGYSAAIQGPYMAGLYAHHSGGTTKMYGELDDACNNRALWVHLPVEEGEYLTEIWAPRAEDVTLPALIFITNRKRGAFLGSFAKPTAYRYYLPHQAQDLPKNICFSERDCSIGRKRIRYFGDHGDVSEEPSVEAVEAMKAMKPHRHLFPLGRAPRDDNETIYPFCFTWCWMENIAEVTLCVNQSAAHRPIVGMQMRYKDGHRACVGQYRLDWAAEPFLVDPVARMGILEEKDEDTGGMYVARVSFRRWEQGDAEQEEEEEGWRFFGSHGKLEWWFSQRTCSIVWFKEARKSW